MDLNNNTSERFNVLTPNQNAEGIEAYTSALDFALDNKQQSNVKNIAVTGPYVSGKSSFLRSYENGRKDKHQFLNISLATFAAGNKAKVHHNEVKQQIGDIERSIVQQMIYKVSAEKLPNSRFHRIVDRVNINGKKACYLGGFTLWLMALIYIIWPRVI